MLTFTGQRNLFGTLSGNSTSANLTVGDTLINQFTRELASSRPWNWREKTKTGVTVASQQAYDLPFDFGILQGVTITSGTTIYTPKEVKSRENWNRINSVSGYTSNAPEYFFIYGDQINFWPIPSTAGLTINYAYLKRARDLSVADYTTGTITSIANGATTVTGDSTTWTALMAGRYIQISEAGGGDGVWYEIASVTSATELELARAYDGVSVAAATATYIIGQTSIIPEDFQILPIYRALEVYFTSIAPEADRADLYKNLYREGLIRMQIELGSKTTQP